MVLFIQGGTKFRVISCARLSHHVYYFEVWRIPVRSVINYPYHFFNKIEHF